MVHEETRVTIESPLDIVTARQAVRELAGRLGFPTSEITIIATAVSEITRNIIEYAKRGEVTVRIVREARRQGLMVVAFDKGPGISRAMQDGFSTGKSLGLGLPGAKRMMDEFSVVSRAATRRRSPASCIDAGMDDHVSKPIVVEKLIEALERIPRNNS